MQRSTLNIILVITGGLVVLSGTFLLMDYESTYTYAVHELGGLTLAAFTIYHLKINWKSILKAFKSKALVYIATSIFLVNVLIMAITGEPESDDSDNLNAAISSQIQGN